jgi:hypothetical protein
LESEDNVEDFPFLEADVLGGSFEEDIEDFIAIETLVFSPEAPVVLDLKEEAMVEMDCFLFFMRFPMMCLHLGSKWKIGR